MTLTKTQRADISTRMFVAISKCLDDESTRFIGTFKHEQKRNYTLLLDAIKMFNNTVKTNMQPYNINECERIQDYLHNLIYDLIKEGKKDIHIFASLCKTLKVIYYTYIQGDWKHKDKDKFISLLLLADAFSKTVENNDTINNDFNYFCTTLIEGETYGRKY